MRRCFFFGGGGGQESALRVGLLKNNWEVILFGRQYLKRHSKRLHSVNWGLIS